MALYSRDPPKMSHFEEKSGIVAAPTDWGSWYQTQSEVVIEVNVAAHTKGKEVRVDMKPKFIRCQVQGKTLFEGEPYDTVLEGECIWTLEDNKLLRIQLVKANPRKDHCWTSLLQGAYQPSPSIIHEMRKKLDLEQFQIENPGFDFSGAKLSKTYDEKFRRRAEEKFGST
eukprot:maker-scaffold321_size207582-snap-gene-1.26 protein:Tk05188 transcript:maker-scaffold321_size207582-snap-gene-1.26-mRNA-1 annotation:"domain-containing protein 2"